MAAVLAPRRALAQVVLVEEREAGISRDAINEGKRERACLAGAVDGGAVNRRASGERASGLDTELSRGTQEQRARAAAPRELSAGDAREGADGGAEIIPGSRMRRSGGRDAGESGAFRCDGRVGRNPRMEAGGIARGGYRGVDREAAEIAVRRERPGEGIVDEALAHGIEMDVTHAAPDVLLATNGRGLDPLAPDGSALAAPRVARLGIGNEGTYETCARGLVGNERVHVVRHERERTQRDATDDRAPREETLGPRPKDERPRSSMSDDVEHERRVAKRASVAGRATGASSILRDADCRTAVVSPLLTPAARAAGTAFRGERGQCEWAELTVWARARVRGERGCWGNEGGEDGDGAGTVNRPTHAKGAADPAARVKAAAQHTGRDRAGLAEAGASQRDKAGSRSA